MLANLRLVRARVFNSLGLVLALQLGKGDAFFTKNLMTLKIQRSAAEGLVVFTLSGRIRLEHLAELQNLLEFEAPDHSIVLDLSEVRLVGRDAVRFLTHCEADGVKLDNCPAYIREWIEKERSRT
jgi:hypothetical protein